MSEPAKAAFDTWMSHRNASRPWDATNYRWEDRTDAERAEWEAAVQSAVCYERQRCARAVCEGCREGWPLEVIDGEPMHRYPVARPSEGCAGTHSVCEAGEILRPEGK